MQDGPIASQRGNYSFVNKDSEIKFGTVIEGDDDNIPNIFLLI